MNGKVLLDTNILIDLFQGKMPFNELQSFGDTFFISVISEIELFCFPQLNKAQEKIIRQFIAGKTVVSFSEEVKEKTIFFRKSYRLKIPDAIVAASAFSLNATLVSNDQVFKKVKEISVCTFKVKK